MRTGALTIALSLALGTTSVGACFAQDREAPAGRAPRASVSTERAVIRDPDYVPGNPRCYLKREVAPSPQGGVLVYRQVC